MGSNQFYSKASGKNMQEAYDKAYQAALEEHGHEEGYSGEINSTHALIDYTSKQKMSGMDLKKFVNEVYDSGEKGVCYGICLKEPKGNDLATKTTVKHHVEKGTKKWKLYYEVCEDYCIGKKETKGEAIKLARKRTEETGKSCTIQMVKKLENGNPLVATIEYKHSKNEKQGEYIFFGNAPC